MDLDPSVVWDFAGTLVGTLRERPRQLPATVSRVDPDGTVWLSMPGADGLVPASTIADVGADDAVTVEWWGNAYHVTGNGTSPSVGTRAAAALRRATAAAAKVAGEAKGIADAVGQHFWADGNGVHVSNEDGNATGEWNILMNSLGILLRQGSAWLASFSDSAVAFYDGLGNAAENIVARFGRDGAQIGYAEGRHVNIGEDGMALYSQSGVEVFNVSTQSATHEETGYIVVEGAGGTATGTATARNLNTSTPTRNNYQGSRVLVARIYYQNPSPYLRIIVRVSARGTTGGGTQKSTQPKVLVDDVVRVPSGATVQRQLAGNGRVVMSTGVTDEYTDVYVYVIGSYLTDEQDFTSYDATTTCRVTEVGYYGPVEVVAPALRFGAPTSDGRAPGAYSTSFGQGLVASGEYQAVIGKYNENSADNAFEIGNGTADDDRSNAYAVGWDGTVTHGGDVPWTNLPLTSSVVAFSDGQVPMYRKWGPVVTLCGAVKMTSAQSANFSVQIGQLPVGCRPKRDLQILCQGSNEDVWLLVVNTAGEVRAGRYRHGASYTAVTTSTWFPFTATFLVA